MSKQQIHETTATVIRTGNSIALRVPKDYVTRNNLKIGTKVVLSDSRPKEGHTVADFKKAIDELRAKGGVKAWDKIKDPAKWQRKIRSEWDDRF